ncbi:MAG: (2Fe-2S) ferredoxin domain-containing protein [Candidatus Omnitrophica bacterium]|nr:(2Fe-2S) ferredoxin domain-containing protein [Candidatus Omnitrophota bacterium]
MRSQKTPYQRIIFVCCNSREDGVCCSPEGNPTGEQFREWLKEYIEKKGLKGKIRVARSGCMDLCRQGPNLMVFPDNIWLNGVRKDELPRIAAEYIETTVPSVA